MSTESIAAPAAPVTPAPAVPAVAGEDWKAMNAEQFKAYGEEKRSAGEKAALKALGVKTAEEAKALLDQGKAAVDAQKTELQKATERAVAAEARATKADVIEKTLARTAARELAAMPEAVQRAVKERAGEDPHAQLEQIEFLRSSGLLPGAAPGVGRPATTAAPAGPRPLAPGSPATAYDTWQALKATSPTAGAHYYQNNRAAIVASTPKTE